MTKQVRVIIQSTENGEKEFVTFLEILEGDDPFILEDEIIPNCTVDFNEIIDMDEIVSFPFGYALQKS